MRPGNAMSSEKAEIFKRGMNELRRLFIKYDPHTKKSDGSVVVDFRKNAQLDTAFVAIQYSNERYSSKDKLIHALNQHSKGGFFPTAEHEEIAIRAEKLFDPEVVDALRQLSIDDLKHAAGTQRSLEDSGREKGTPEETRAWAEENEINNPEIDALIAAVEASDAPSPPVLPTPLRTETALRRLKFATGVDWEVKPMGNKNSYQTCGTFSTPEGLATASSKIMEVLGKSKEGFPTNSYLSKDNKAVLMASWVHDQNAGNLTDSEAELRVLFRDITPPQQTLKL